MVNGHAIRKHSLYQKSVGLFWKGLYIGRGLANSTTQTQTTYQVTIKAKMTEFANRFNSELTDAQRQAWDTYAGSLGTAADREAGDTGGNAMNVIPKHRRKLQTGINAYVSANMTEFLADAGGPDDTAPLGDASPPPPFDVALSGNLAGLIVTWTDPVLVGTPSKKFIRLWLKKTTKAKVHAQYLKTIAIGVETSTVTQMRRSRYMVALDKGIYRVQLDTITQSASGRGCITGPGSNVAEIKLIS